MQELLKSFNSSVIPNAYELFGAFVKGNSVTFRVWAPNAKAVSVVGEFNNWDAMANPMKRIDGGCFETTIEGVKNYSVYKYAVLKSDGTTVLKSDPYGRHFETAPSNGSKVYKDAKYKWCDG